MKRIGWVSDYFYPNFLGGAEITDYILIETGKELGYEVDRRDVSDFRGYDLLVLNIHNVPEFLVWEMIKEKYVFFSHDPTTHSFTATLLNRSRLNIFLSPLHRNWYQQRFKELKEPAVIPSPIDVSKCRIGEKIEGVCVHIGLLEKHKGYYNIIEYARSHPKLEFRLFGKVGNVTVYHLPNVVYEGGIPHEEAYEVLSKAEHYIHLPEWMEAFGRSVAEAYLCGCKLIVNENVGCLSYDWWGDYNAIKEKLSNSKYEFWKAVEGAI